MSAQADPLSDEGGGTLIAIQARKEASRQGGKADESVERAETRARDERRAHQGPGEQARPEGAEGKRERRKTQESIRVNGNEDR